LKANGLAKKFPLDKKTLFNGKEIKSSFYFVFVVVKTFIPEPGNIRTKWKRPIIFIEINFIFNEAVQKGTSEVKKHFSLFPQDVLGFVLSSYHRSHSQLLIYNFERILKSNSEGFWNLILKDSEIWLCFLLTKNLVRSFSTLTKLGDE